MGVNRPSFCEWRGDLSQLSAEEKRTLAVSIVRRSLQDSPEAESAFEYLLVSGFPWPFDELDKLRARLVSAEVDRDAYLEQLAEVFPGSTYNDKWEAIRRAE